jgi:hypothetical protein
MGRLTHGDPVASAQRDGHGIGARIFDARPVALRAPPE